MFVLNSVNVFYAIRKVDALVFVGSLCSLGELLCGNTALRSRSCTMRYSHLRTYTYNVRVCTREMIFFTHTPAVCSTYILRTNFPHVKNPHTTSLLVRHYYVSNTRRTEVSKRSICYQINYELVFWLICYFKFLFLVGIFA